MDRIRALIYRLGFRPRLGSIFFSPSRNVRAAWGYVAEGFSEGIKNGSAIRISESRSDVRAESKDAGKVTSRALGSQHDSPSVDRLPSLSSERTNDA